MLFTIEDDVVAHLHDITVDKLKPFEWIAHSIEARRIALFASRKTLYALANVSGVGDNVQNVYWMLYERFSQLKSSFDSVSFAISIRWSNDEEMASQEDTTKTIIRIGLKDINPGLFLNPQIIGENLSDIYFLESMGKWYSNVYHQQDIEFKNERTPGGGGTTYTVLKEKIENSHAPILCVVDSDKWHPTSSCGKTSKKTMEVWDDLQPKYPLRTSYCCVYPLNELREIENLIPPDIIVSISDNPGNDCNEFLRLIRGILNNKDFELLRYYDYKKGIKETKVNAQLGKNNYFDKMMLYHDPDEMQAYNQRLNKLEETKKLAFPKAVGGLLKESAKVIETMITKQKLQIPDYLLPHWEIIGQWVYSFSIVSPFEYRRA